jgi:3-oxoacyl-[acyl-carrier protein] reductase
MYSSNTDIENWKILITGGSAGIGKATARRLRDLGADVLITGPDESRLKPAARAAGCNWVRADVSVEADVARTYDWIEEHWNGRLDALINNAGIGEFAPVEEAAMESYHRVMGVNFFGPVHMTRLAIPLMRKQKGGVIINIGASSAFRGFANGSIYASSKFALRGFTECLREEVRNQNIRVCFVSPSEVTSAFGNPERGERKPVRSKLAPDHLAGVIVSILSMPADALIPEISVWATNPLY